MAEKRYVQFNIFLSFILQINDYTRQLKWRAIYQQAASSFGICWAVKTPKLIWFINSFFFLHQSYMYLK